MTRLTHRKTFVKLLVSTGLGGHNSKLGPYKIQKLKDLAFFFFFSAQSPSLSMAH